ncbi:palmitoleoyl-protein carboxylesterase notum1-like [Ornithodoros turicata]|uniref:palmitoleoyl-protein carboxylesterase notum1-like n=1 Tax=Ornithodoros turicata TaxID=34597 RepID=UPI003139F2F1
MLMLSVLLGLGLPAMCPGRPPVVRGESSSSSMDIPVWANIVTHRDNRTVKSNHTASPSSEITEHFTRSLHKCGSHRDSLPRMRRMMLSKKNVTCNDGTPAGYYMRRAHGSRRWIIFLEGGWHCYDSTSCGARWMRTPHLMSSAHWQETRHVGGILSPDPEENKYWWNVNHVFIPYCSSDAWSGTARPKNEGEYAFMGSIIIQEVVNDLLSKGLYEARILLLAGSSAGGVGVLLNVDRVADYLAFLKSKVKVRGVVDSGWFLDNEPFEPRECMEPHACSPIEVIKRGVKLWDGQLPERCTQHYAPEDQWKCSFGYRIYDTLRAPTFVIQWLFDEAQMTVDNVGPPKSKAQWDYIHAMGDKLKQTLKNVTALFAPSCISHVVLTKRDWQQVKIQDVSLPQALRCWELQRHEHNHHHHHPKHHLYDLLPASSNGTRSPYAMIADMPIGKFHIPSQGRQRGKNKRRNRKHRRRKKNERRAHAAAAMLRDRRSPSPDSAHVQHRWKLHEDLCQHWLMDVCSWPQCNRNCPRLRNPFTGEEMDFVELLVSFGLDINSVASALGVGVKALKDMNHDTLLELLTHHEN